MAGCRDCSVCTMSGIGRLARSFPVFALTVMTLGMLRLFTRHCPQCHHRLARHARRPDGSFKD
jgi:hypothetical protein